MREPQSEDPGFISEPERLSRGDVLSSEQRVYYNENDPKAARWLVELIAQGHLPHGTIDTRSIEDVTPLDLVGYDHCHFFAGIGGWPLALQWAGIGADTQVWTGSCPCQPFSQAGKGKGTADERHLWPAFFHLIEECRPAVVFGEQVASKAGRVWLDSVQTDLEALGYAVGAADLCAAGVGAPHIRQRLYWVAESGSKRQQGIGLRLLAGGSQQDSPEARRGSEIGIVGDSSSTRGGRDTGALSRAQGSPEGQVRSLVDQPEPTGSLGHPDNTGSQGRSERRDGTGQRSPWEASLVDCRDGKRRPVEPGTFPLAHGIPGRVGLLRGYGNAIVPQVAEAFIRSYLDVA